MKKIILTVTLFFIILGYSCNKYQSYNTEKELNSISAKLLTDTSFANLTRSFLRQSLILLVESKTKNISIDKIAEITISAKSENDYLQKINTLKLNQKLFDSALITPFVHLAQFQSSHQDFGNLSSSDKQKVIQKTLGTIIKSRKFRNEHPNNTLVNSFKVYAKHLIQIKTNN
jgi:hypothetical protein